MSLDLAAALGSFKAIAAFVAGITGLAGLFAVAHRYMNRGICDRMAKVETRQETLIEQHKEHARSVEKRFDKLENQVNEVRKIFVDHLTRKSD